MKPTPIADSEKLARCLYDPSFFDDGQLSARAFALRDYRDKSKTLRHESSISVLRECMCDVKETSERLPKLEGETIIGYASLSKKDIESINSPLPGHDISVRVKPTPSTNIPAHAAIFTKIDGINIKGRKTSGHSSPLMSYVQAQLVAKAEVILFD